MRCQLTEGNTGHFKAAEISATTAGHFAAVDETGRTRITGQHRKAGVVLFLFQLSTKSRVFLDSARFTIVSGDPTLFGHGEGNLLVLSRIQAENQ